MIPGSNLLNVALSVIGKQTVLYYRATGRTKNSVGQWVTEYADGFARDGNLQPVPKSLFSKAGLDYQKNYLSCYFSGDTSDIQRGESGDSFVFGGRRWQFLSETDWSKIDGWTVTLAVDIGEEPGH